MLILINVKNLPSEMKDDQQTPIIHSHLPNKNNYSVESVESLVPIFQNKNFIFLIPIS